MRVLFWAPFVLIRTFQNIAEMAEFCHSWPQAQKARSCFVPLCSNVSGGLGWGLQLKSPQIARK